MDARLFENLIVDTAYCVDLSIFRRCNKFCRANMIAMDTSPLSPDMRSGRDVSDLW